MIVIIAVLAILLFISCIGLHVLNQGVKESHKVAINFQNEWLAEIKDKQEVSERLTSTASELVKANMQAQELQQKLESTTQQNDKPEEETGNYVRSRSFKPATPETYRLVFDFDAAGQRVLAHLQSKYLRDAYVDDQHGGERETCVRLGQRQVISYIVNQINEANEPTYFKEIDNDD